MIVYLLFRQIPIHPSPVQTKQRQLSHVNRRRFPSRVILHDLALKLLKREFGSELLDGVSTITSVLLGERLTGSIIVPMLAGWEALERYALRSASSVLAGPR